ncbi:unnamed protein product [Clonostachys rosea f. rosea IK726]|uniref:Uncharacterized protein n=1 Tax=Clonostachys rosea f. rosea IK726 TaxID=1349383 RepID=A0ACA9UTZ9_BIOOC|nr:unnamed protein product [Clonostachys rosea f. rosea IK726]
MATQLGLSTLPPMASSPYVGSVDSLSRYSLTSQAPFLTRALYFPSHSNSTTHLPLYNITDSYRESVGHHGVDSAGASRTQLDSIERPSGNSWNDDVRFLIDYDPARQVAALTERTLERDRCEINMSLPSSLDDGFCVRVVAPAQLPLCHVSVSSPTSRRTFRRADPKLPSFVIKGSGPNSPNLEWRARPSESDVVTYELHELYPLFASKGSVPYPKALYQHFQPTGKGINKAETEGILLLSDTLDLGEEAVIISSLVGLLWANRTSIKQSSKKEKKEVSRLRRIFTSSL